MKKIMILIFLIVGGLTTTITAILQYIDSDEKENLADKKEKELNQKIENLLMSNLQQSSQISKLSIENTNLSKQLAIATKDITEKNLGGYQISPDAYLTTQNSFHLQIKNIDKLTIFNGYVSVIDIEKLNLSKIISENKNEIVFSSKNVVDYYEGISGDINPGQCLTLPKEYNIDEPKHFYIEFVCRKSGLIMHLIMFKQNNNIKTAHKIFEIKDENLVLKEIKGNIEESYWMKHFFSDRRIKYSTFQ